MRTPIRTARLVEQQRFWGSTALPTATAALEACSGLVGRVFSAVVVKTENDTVSGVLTPACLSLIGAAGWNP